MPIKHVVDTDIEQLTNGYGDIVNSVRQHAGHKNWMVEYQVHRNGSSWGYYVSVDKEGRCVQSDRKLDLKVKK